MAYTTDDLEAIITANSHMFTPGNTLTSGALCKLAGLTNRRKFKDYSDQQSHNLQKMCFYVSLNKVLALRGLHIKSQNYYSKFRILPMKEVPARIKAYRQTSVAKARRATTLSKGQTHAGVWSPLTTAEKASLL